MILTIEELQNIRQGCASTLPVNYTKTQINAAAQAVENLLTNNASAISNAIDSATSPFIFSNTQKKLIVAQVVFAKYLRDR